MADYGHELQFGVFIAPSAADAERVLELAKLADVLDLDLVSFQDHPYQPRFLDAWTLLSVVAAQTSSVRVAPNVANLPLRQPVVLARSVASLDILSGGRVELGLGAGAFWDAIAAVGGPRLTPGEGVDALAEAIEVIRGIWGRGGDPFSHEGEHYRIHDAHPGPPPAHAVEIWLGAYKPRMLALTGAKADGWLPSMGYTEVAELGEMNAAIDAAAVSAGRNPAEIRRLYNLNGSFGTETGFLQGSPSDWVEQLAALTFGEGFSTYILSADSPEPIRRFATEVAPAVHAAVEAGRGRADDPPVEPSARFETPSEARFAVTPTPDDGTRLSPERPWDEGSRPVAPPPDPERRYSADQLAAGRHLIDVHDGLRGELSRLREAIDQVAAGSTDPTALRSLFNRMTIRQNNWTLGAFCESYCRAVTGHHSLEDRSVFPHLKQGDAGLESVLARLGEEHETIAEILDRIDTALIGLVAAEPEAMDRVRATVDLVSDAMASHFSYEERELIEPLARLGFY